METSEYVRAVEEQGGLLASAAADALDLPVPSCPGWTVARVVEHTGKVHRHVADRVRRGSTTAEDVVRVTAPEEPAVVPWFEEGVAALVEVLASADLDRPVWNWSETVPQTAAFWPRRMAQETAVHRTDVQLARGSADPIEPALAADGIDEFFEVCLPLDVDAFAGEGETVVLRATDAPAEWAVRALPGGAEISRGTSPEPAATIAGGASDLLLVLWRRLGPGAVDLSGDRALVDRFVAAADLD
jgi:uncharacterized protein (TIGR03083 family)